MKDKLEYVLDFDTCCAICGRLVKCRHVKWYPRKGMICLDCKPKKEKGD